MKDFESYAVDFWDDNPNEQERISKEHQDRIMAGREIWNKWASEFREYFAKNDAEGEIKLCNYLIIK